MQVTSLKCTVKVYKKLKAHYFLSQNGDLVDVHVVTCACQYVCSYCYSQLNEEVGKRFNGIIANEEGS
jgi:hypothetical protein